MKKFVLFVSILLVLFLAAIYVFMPRKVIVSSVATFNANREGVYRFLAADSNWKKWWPGGVKKTSVDSLCFTYKDYDFQVSEMLYNAIRLNLHKSGPHYGGLLQLFSFSSDSMRAEISAEIDGNADPFSKLSTYIRSKEIEKALHDIVLSLGKYAAELKNVYGIDIKKEKVQYQSLVSTKASFSHYPTTEDVYALIGRLRKYISESGAIELFSPMLNISTNDSITYTAQVGVPVDRVLPDKGDISLKWMMKGGNILSGDVTGGRKEIEYGLRQMKLYIGDYQRSVIAIPFQMLITDRGKQPDSTKWVTRIYYPVV